MSFSDVGRVYSPHSFRDKLAALPCPDWVRGVTLHHTGAPSLSTRPRGLLPQHIENIAGYYQRELGWKSGPHLFIDEDQIWGMTPLNEKGVHARSFNGSHIGIEVLGEYDSEDPTTGRGLACWQMAAIATAQLVQWICRARGEPLNVPTTLRERVNFHRDDRKTTKSCPGNLVKREWFLNLVAAVLTGELPQPPVAPSVIFREPFVPVRAWLDARGYQEVILRTHSGQTYLRGVPNPSGKPQEDFRLERASYDRATETTIAPERELRTWEEGVKRNAAAA